MYVRIYVLFYSISELRDIRKRSQLSHILSSYNIPREVTPTSANGLMIIRCILSRGKYAPDSLKHALQV